MPNLINLFILLSPLVEVAIEMVAKHRANVWKKDMSALLHPQPETEGETPFGVKEVHTPIPCSTSDVQRAA